MAASGSRKQTQDSRGGGSGGTTCSLPNGIRTGPVTNDVVADSRDQPNIRAHSAKAGTITTTHGLPTRIARNVRAGPVPSTCEAAQPPRPLTLACRRPPIALYLEGVMWEHPRHAVLGRERPIEPWSAETGAERGSSRPGLPEPG